ncbi:MAG TPA: HlyD family efflux transporter periplasmic adaptor subunit [Anaerolineae bacterium]|nr:HlyD family efflux transporter periplasmic adaptor subunit [Anaerolineae bacterium]
MNRSIHLAGAFLVVGALISACGGSPAAPASQATLPPVIDDAAVSTEGRLVPVESVALSFGIGGEVAEVLVAEGDIVEAGDRIARLNDDSLQAAVAQAEAGLAVVKANQAKYRETLPQQIAAAEAELSSAQAQLAEASAGRDSTATSIEAEAALAEARFAQQQAQTAYDRIIEAGLGGPVEERARLALESAVKTTQAAQARVDALKAGSPGDRADSAQIAAAVAGVQAIQARLDQLKSEAAGTAVDTHAAAVQQAEAALLAAQVALAQVDLRAPMGGTVARIDLKPGERVGPGAIVAVIADLSSWQVETDDLTEIDVPAVSVGQPVTVRVDALPDVALKGEVASIGLLFQEKSGDVTYPVKIRLLGADPRLRWGMTVAVTFGK